ncbi:MAG: hypothetical protein IKF45_08200, partial [Lachnospiraceae bacterium]|nr:hypothetical protein [Lachnospiraceae bacterium]
TRPRLAVFASRCTDTAIFMPLTLIAGWYGMNFRYMPDLEWRYSYLCVFIACLLIAGGSLWYFKKKKWL